MAIVRSFTNGFEVVDWTQEVNVIPNQWGTINSLGLFSTEPVAEHVVVFEEIRKDGALIVDRVRGERAAQGKDYIRKLHTFAVPHFPYDDAISPSDIQGKRAYGAVSEAETLEAVRTRKLERIRQNHAWTLEYARANTIVAGTAYAPNNTVVQDWNAEFGITRSTVDFTFGTSTADMVTAIENTIALIQNNGGSISMSGVVALCSTEFFSALIKHASIKTAYQYFQSTQDPLRTRLAAGGSAVPMHREFYHAGIRFIEMRDSYAGSRLIPAGQAFAVPTGTEIFKTYFSPANRFGLVNTLGEELYVFETQDVKGTKIEIESESNHISALLRPELVIQLSTSN
jgi:hypothetical protein